VADREACVSRPPYQLDARLLAAVGSLVLVEEASMRHTTNCPFPILPAALLVLPSVLGARKALSQTRIVQLSYVWGTVTVQRPGSTEWSDAPPGTPIQQGLELRTSAGSYAEVEFENGSIALLGQLSEIKFGELAMDSEGDKLNRLDLRRGYASFSFRPEHHDFYEVTRRVRLWFRTAIASSAPISITSGFVLKYSKARSMPQTCRDRSTWSRMW
jgi:hypothetical protein